MTITPFPQDRICPYHPPTEHRSKGDGHRPLSLVRLFDGRQVWPVTGHAEARALRVDPQLSSNRENPVFPMVTERLARSTKRRVELLGVDDPECNERRRMLIPSFSVKRTAALRPRIQETVDRLLDAVIEQWPPADLVSAFALPVPSMVIRSLLGVPYADHEFFEAQSRRLLRGPDAADVEGARAALDEYFRTLIARKRAEPGEGLLDELIAQQLDSGAINREELVQLSEILLVAGHETTANMISLGTFTLLQYPDQLDRLRTSEDLMVRARGDVIEKPVSSAKAIQAPHAAARLLPAATPPSSAAPPPARHARVLCGPVPARTSRAVRAAATPSPPTGSPAAADGSPLGPGPESSVRLRSRELQVLYRVLPRVRRTGNG